MAGPFGILTEADILALFTQWSELKDTYNILGGGAGAAASAQELLDQIVRDQFDVDLATGFTVAGGNTVTVTLSAAQVAAGFTTAHIVSSMLETLTSATELSITDTDSKTDEEIVFRLSGVETETNGHKAVVTLRKNKA